MPEENKTEGFKLPASSLDEVFKIVQGYADHGKAGSLSDISKKTGMHSTVISRNNGFLLSIGVLEGGKNKSPSSLGIQLGRALAHDVQDEVQSTLSDIVSENDFLRSIIAAIRIRRGMDESGLRSHIAYSAGQSKTQSTSTGAGAVVELLKRSGHIKEADGKLVVAAPSRQRSNDEQSDGDHSTPAPREAASTGPIIVSKGDGASGISISIEVQVACGPADLEDLGVQLRKVIDDLSRVSGSSSGEV